MSLTVAINDLLNVRIVYTNVATATAMNVLHYRVGSLTGTIPSISTFLTAVAGELATQWRTVWKPCASDQVKLVEVAAYSVFPLPRSTGFHSVFSPAIAGDVISEALPLQDSVTILKRTEVGNRTGLGRLFFVGISEDQQSNGIINAALRTNLDAMATWLLSSPTIPGSGWSAVLNPCLVNGPEDNPVAIRNVVATQVSNNVIKTQRRRRPGKGI